MSDGRADKPRHLGRGLESLIGPITATGPAEPPGPGPAQFASAPDTERAAALREVALAAITANPYQARTMWNEQDLSELSESIRANGVIQPIVVRPFQGGYQVIAGERRLRAAQMAGRTTIPALVRTVTDEQLFEWSLIENIHRRDLNAIERAKAYQRYLGAFSLTQAQAGERLGEDRSVIANYLRLLDLPEEIKQMLVEGRLTMGHARAILSLPTDELRRKLANRALAGRLSVREVERLVRRYLGEESTPRPEKPAKAANIADLEDKLCRYLGTRVSIETKRGGQRGRIVVEFDSLDEFDRITEAIGLTCREEA